MRVLHVVANPSIGGLERVVEGLATGQHEIGIEVKVAAVMTSAAVSPMLGALGAGGVPTEIIRVTPRGYAAERRSIASLCHAWRPDVVHTHGYRADVIDAPAARAAGVPTVTTVHGFTGGDWKNRLYEWLQVRAFRRFDAVVAVSEPLGRLLAARGVSSPRLRTIVNAWRPGAPPLTRAAARQALGVPDDGVRLGFVGRLTHEKGADIAVEAMALLKGTGAHLSVVGDGRERPAVEGLARQLGVAGRVRCHGAIADAARLLPAFDALVLSSRTEGTPIILFEAMAALVPLVAARVGGVPDVVTPEEAELVIPESPADLARGIRAVLDDPRRSALRAGRAQARLAGQFGAGPWLTAYTDTYRFAVGGAR